MKLRNAQKPPAPSGPPPAAPGTAVLITGVALVQMRQLRRAKELLQRAALALSNKQIEQADHFVTLAKQHVEVASSLLADGMEKEHEH